MTESANELASAIKANYTLKDLNLSFNKLGNKRMSAFTLALHSNSTLTSLNIGKFT